MGISLIHAGQRAAEAVSVCRISRQHVNEFRDLRVLPCECWIAIAMLREPSKPIRLIQHGMQAQ
jgi:hypothetical protein